MNEPHHRVVVVGGGFGGLFATRALRNAPVEVTLVDRNGHHLFQPLLYQVATGILSQGEIARPLREILRHQENASLLLGEVSQLDLVGRTVTSSALGRTTITPYDSLVLATGATHSYFGNGEFAAHAPGLKSIDDALEIRGRIFEAFELADQATDPAEQRRHLTFVVVGGGPTGIEMAGQLCELSRHSLRKNFRHIDPASARIILLEAGPVLLPTFGSRLSHCTRRALVRMGVDVRVEREGHGDRRDVGELRDPGRCPPGRGDHEGLGRRGQCQHGRPARGQGHGQRDEPLGPSGRQRGLQRGRTP